MANDAATECHPAGGPPPVGGIDGENIPNEGLRASFGSGGAPAVVIVPKGLSDTGPVPNTLGGAVGGKWEPGFEADMATPAGPAEARAREKVSAGELGGDAEICGGEVDSLSPLSET